MLTERKVEPVFTHISTQHETYLMTTIRADELFTTLKTDEIAQKRFQNDKSFPVYSGRKKQNLGRKKAKRDSV